MHLIQADWIKWFSPQVSRGTVGQSRTCRDAALSLPHCLTLRRLAHFTIWAPFFTSTVSGYIRAGGEAGVEGVVVERRLRRFWMTVAEQEVEGILVWKGNKRRRGQRQKETGKENVYEAKTGQTGRCNRNMTREEREGKKKEIMYKQSS